MTYTGARTLREVSARYLAKSAGAAETAHTLAQAPGDSGRSVRAYAHTYLAGSEYDSKYIFYPVDEKTRRRLQRLDRRLLDVASQLDRSTAADN